MPQSELQLEIFKLGIEGLPQGKDFLYKVGLFLMIVNSIEKIISEYLIRDHKIDISSETLGRKISKLKKINIELKNEHIKNIIDQLEDDKFRKFRDSLVHDNIIVNPWHIEPLTFWGENLEKRDEIDFNKIANEIENSISFARGIFFDFFTFYQFNEVDRKKFDFMHNTYITYWNKGC